MTLDEAIDTLDALAAVAPAAGGAVRLELAGTEATLTIDHAEARNAVTLGMMADLARSVRRLGAWDGGILRLRAAGSREFCSGGHLGQVRRAIRGEAGALAMAEAMTATLDGLLALPVISVAELDGAAIGGGAELATATDFRVGGARARIHFVHARLGIAPGWGGAGRLALHVGSRSALRLLAAGEALDPEAARRVGLLDEAADTASAAAAALLGPIAGQATVALRAVKAQIAASRAGDRGGEGRAFAGVWGGPAHTAALQALGRGG